MSDRDFYRAIPEPGQLVEVRGRRFSVADIRSAIIPDNPIYSEINSNCHLPR